MSAAEPEWVAPIPIGAYSSTITGSRLAEVARIQATIEALDEAPGLEPTPYYDPDAGGIVQAPAFVGDVITEAWPGLGASVLESLGVRCLRDIEPSAPAPLLVAFLDSEGHTIAFGDGGVGKGIQASAWAVELVAAGHTVLILDYEDHPTEWARRIDALGGPGVRDRVFHCSPHSHDWTGQRGAIWQQADRIRDVADAVGATYVVIDSIVPACGATDPLKPEAPGQYAEALQVIGRPALSLAHATKAGDNRHPFGSVFWSNLARLTWSLTKAPGEGHRVILQCRKSNNHPGLGRFVVTTNWYEGRPVEVSVQGYVASISDDVADALEAGAMTVAELVDRLNEDREDGTAPVKADSVQKALRRGIASVPQRFTVEGTGKGARWSNA